jgi:hypothetical protein
LEQTSDQNLQKIRVNKEVSTPLAIGFEDVAVLLRPSTVAGAVAVAVAVAVAGAIVVDGYPTLETGASVA